MSMNSNKYKTFNIHEKTPKSLYDSLNLEFNFNFDPCPLNGESSSNGLVENWGRVCFVNPPYGKAIKDWLNKAVMEIEEGNTETAVFLLPASTDVKWFHEIVLSKAKEIRFIKGRLKFGNHMESAPFASMIVVFSRRRDVMVPVT